MADRREYPESSTDGESDGEETTRKVPAEVVEEVERLTRLARKAVDDAAAIAYRERREALLSEHGFTSRVRGGEADTLVLYPDEWVEDGTVQLDRIENVDRGIERPLEGPGVGTDWENVEAHNRAVAEQVTEREGPIHGANAHALADYMSNHYAKRIDRATEAELREFLEEYYVRNVWSTPDQRAVVEESISLTVDLARENRSRGWGEWPG